ncbi:hypothetical protein CLCR_07638 [Cladophialophora carrionii]|uniref:Uncharacterized protein n=1 Tax=Cladophialophora carrionii TaxID=86049 RepID=A0A1C1CMV9_9EURO|nr:hypothetical protein CLCR_07638 [Cladophialophora carrionii]
MSVSPVLSNADLASNNDRKPSMDWEPIENGTDHELASPTAPKTQAAQSTEATSSPAEPPWRHLPPYQKYCYPWTEEELLEAVREDHSWLNPDPAKAEWCKRNLMESTHPAVTFALLKQWTVERLEAARPKSRQVTVQLGPPRNEDKEEYVVVERKKKTIRPKQSSHCDEDDYVWV